LSSAIMLFLCVCVCACMYLCVCARACVCVRKCPTVLVSLSGVGAIVELKVLRPFSMGLGQSSYGLLALPQEILPTQGSSA